MPRRYDAENGEELIISVTPIVGGIVRPLCGIVLGSLVTYAAVTYIGALRAERWWLASILVGPFALIFAARVLRWRSHRVTLTSQRVVVRAGVLRRVTSSVDLDEVVTTRIDAGLGQRLSRRGRVILEGATVSMDIGLLRHPRALVRLIDAQRRGQHEASRPLDTVFSPEDAGYHAPPSALDAFPRQPRDRG